MLYVVVALSVLLLLAVIVGVILLRSARRAARRMSLLNQEMLQASRDASVGRRLSVPRDAESAQLVNTINRLFDALACSAVLRQLYPESLYVEINPEDAERLGIGSNDLVRIASRRGTVTATAFITPTIRSGQVFLPMHYESVNRLTHPSFDSYSRQPNYKHCAVRVAKK